MAKNIFWHSVFARVFVCQGRRKARKNIVGIIVSPPGKFFRIVDTWSYRVSTRIDRQKWRVAKQWLSEQHNNNNARIAGNNACSNFNNNNVNNSNRFRAVFRPNHSYEAKRAPLLRSSFRRLWWFIPDKIVIITIYWTKVHFQNAKVSVVE